MKLFVKIDTQEEYYEVLHAWATQKLLSQIGVETAFVLPEKKEDSVNKQSWFIKILGRKDQRRIEIEKKYCLDFAKNYLTQEERAEGVDYNKITYVMGQLLVPSNSLTKPNDEEEYYFSSLLLLNLWDFHKFLTLDQPENPYLFSYLEKDGLKKPEFVEKVVKQKKLLHRYAGTIEPCYENAEYTKELTPEQLIDQIYHSAFVITDSCIVLELAIAFKKDFLYLSGGKREGLVALMLQQFGLIENFVYDTEDPIYVKRGKASFAKLSKLKVRVKKQLLEIFPEITFDQLTKLNCPTNITKNQCYGCLACKEVCPQNAITMKEDKEGFLYPTVDLDKCIRCGLCEKICIRNRRAYLDYKEGYPKAICASNRLQEARRKSSSGGIFPLLAEYAIKEQKGVVVGVRFDKELKAVSDIAETMEEVTAFFGSKYVKSSFDGIFPRIKQLLEQGRYVLYSGLPCECAGLRSYLRKEYENLFVVEIMCHSVPSPKVFRLYLDYLEKRKKSKLVRMTFRDKTDPIQKMKFEFENGNVVTARYKKNNYFRAFYNDLIVRPSCSKCTFVYNHRVGDLTLGDFWGVLKYFPEYRGYRGVNMILINTQKGDTMIQKIKEYLEWREITFRQAFTGNHKKAGTLKPERTEVFGKLSKVPINTLLEQYNDLKQKTEPKESEEGIMIEDEESGENLVLSNLGETKEEKNE